MVFVSADLFWNTQNKLLTHFVLVFFFKAMSKFISATSRQFAKLRPFCETHETSIIVGCVGGIFISTKPLLYNKRNWDQQNAAEITYGIIGTTIVCITLGLQPCIVMGCWFTMLFTCLEDLHPKDKYNYL